MGKMRFEILGDTGEMESDILEEKTHVKGCLDFLIHPDSGRKLLLPYMQLDMPNHTKQATGKSHRFQHPNGNTDRVKSLCIHPQGTFHGVHQAVDRAVLKFHLLFGSHFQGEGITPPVVNHARLFSMEFSSKKIHVPGHQMLLSLFLSIHLSMKIPLLTLKIVQTVLLPLLRRSWTAIDGNQCLILAMGESSIRLALDLVCLPTTVQFVNDRFPEKGVGRCL